MISRVLQCLQLISIRLAPFRGHDRRAVVTMHMLFCGEQCVAAENRQRFVGRKE